MKAILSIIISGALIVSGFGQTRNVLVGTNNVVVQPANFWSADSSNARTGLGLGSAATNPATAFQPSSSILTNLSTNNGGSLTNLTASSLVGALSLGQGGTGATNASGARVSLGLGTAATNPASAFQASSSALTNLASNNGGNLTNLQATNIVGVIPSSNIPSITLTNIDGILSIVSGGTGATNASNARVNLGATTVGDALFTAVDSASARTAIGASSIGSTIFTAIDAASVRSSLSLGTASTNPSSAFQSSSLALSNLASNNGSALTNIQASGLVGIIPSSNIPSFTFTNLSGTLTVSQGGTSATNAANARANLGSTMVGDALFIATNAAAARTAIGALATNGDATNLTNFPATLLRATGSAAGLTNFPTVALASNVTGIIAISNGGSGATTAGGARTNLGLGETNAVTFEGVIVNASDGASAFRFGTNFTGLWSGVDGTSFSVRAGGNNLLIFQTNRVLFNTNIAFDGGSGGVVAAQGRTNLGLGWAALTNTNAGTSLVSVDTNGDVVSPTNFWQRAPIQTLVQDLTGIVTTQTNNATNARNVYVYSLATNVSEISNTIILPTNTSTFNGDEVTVIHKGATNTTTVVRQAGSTNNLITINRFDESVKFIRELGQWDFYHNISFVEPIQFSGTNASNNAAASRTNLGLGWSALTNSNAANFRTAAGLGQTDTVTLQKLMLNGTTSALFPFSIGQKQTQGTNEKFYGLSWDGQYSGDLTYHHDVASISSEPEIRISSTAITVYSPITFASGSPQTRTNLGLGQFKDAVGDNWAELYDNGELRLQAGNNIVFYEAFSFGGTNAENYKSQSRISLGLGATWLTNTNVTNFRTAIGLGASDRVVFGSGFTNHVGIGIGSTNTGFAADGIIQGNIGAVVEGTLVSIFDNQTGLNMYLPISFDNVTNAATTRTNLGLGATNIVTFAGITNNGDIRINQTTPTNGLLYIYRTNNEPFLGMANLIASNNTTVSNETLFRVGVAEATNKSAQFGFRSTNTNGDGVAVFSTFGYNALMMIGPSARSQNNAAVEADIYSVNPTNRVATLIDTNTGAFTLHRSIGFRTNETNASPVSGANFSDRSRWLQIHVGTNTFYVPLFQ